MKHLAVLAGTVLAATGVAAPAYAGGMPETRTSTVPAKAFPVCKAKPKALEPCTVRGKYVRVVDKRGKVVRLFVGKRYVVNAKTKARFRTCAYDGSDQGVCSGRTYVLVVNDRARVDMAIFADRVVTTRW